MTKVGFKNHGHLIERPIKGCEIALNRVCSKIGFESP